MIFTRLIEKHFSRPLPRTLEEAARRAKTPAQRGCILALAHEVNRLYGGSQVTAGLKERLRDLFPQETQSEQPRE